MNSKYPLIRILPVALIALTTFLSVLSYSANAFSFPNAQAGRVNVDEMAERDVFTMEEWAYSCGVQVVDGFELTSEDGYDYSVRTNSDVPAGSPVVAVPSQMILSSLQAWQDLGDNALLQAEQQLIEAKLDHTLPLFRLFVKILIEYEKGPESPWFPWLNSLPRFYNTGASMTYACFDCLPPYAAGLAMQERVQSVNFQKAATFLPMMSEDTTTDRDLLKWAYNVAVTRSVEWNGERLIAPMADMFNHGTNPEAYVTYDKDMNCMVYAAKDTLAGSPLRISLGDPTNPSPLFATYGFLDETCPASFCKLMHMQDEMKELGYDFSNLLFYKDTGEISMETYDVVLYSILLKNDPSLAQEFYQAVTTGDEATKNQFHEQYFSYTKEELQKHVDDTLRKLEGWSSKAQSYDPTTHPRVPVILGHNAFVKQTFMKVKQNLDNM
ncbi:unnamed protein product [Cylindrotheca closterium]|uniref:SET domain-containing protein n=1 Tax=Cylindrotheca closterium TaxID=2856 RepID=A0AAD2PX01_9STRA|nr:unnamed protein product [Cylindrotheca closterium]